MKQEITNAIEEAEKELMEKQIEQFSNDIQEATRRASAILVDETRAFVKANHRYHSKNDFDKAHTKTLAELEAEYLIEQGYVKQVQGEWITVPSSDLSTGKAYKCSVCQKMRYGSFMPPYCQICGAKMKGN